MGDNKFVTKTEAFDIHGVLYSAMIWFGIYKLHSPKHYLERLHFAYRMAVIAVVCTINLQHLIYIYNMAVFSRGLHVDAFIEEISHINFVGKLIGISLNSSKLEELHAVIKDPIFAPDDKKDEEYIKKYKRMAFRAFMSFNVVMIFSVGLWVLNRIISRIQNPAFNIPVYVPYDTTTWHGFIYAVSWETFASTWTGFGHYGLDCMFVSYYIQATCQLESIKYKLQHMLDYDETMITDTGSFKFKDKLDESLSKRFVYYVQRYGKITWFIDQVNSALNLGISVNIMTSSVVLCFIVYGLRLVSVFSVQFMFTFAALLVFQSQMFLYCYYGHLLQHESDSVNTAVYFSDWVSVSPKFRRLILIGMCRWHYRVIPMVASVVPVSLTTFVAITRLGYAIYTVLKSYEANSA